MEVFAVLLVVKKRLLEAAYFEDLEAVKTAQIEV